MFSSNQAKGPSPPITGRLHTRHSPRFRCSMVAAGMRKGKAKSRNHEEQVTLLLARRSVTRPSAQRTDSPDSTTHRHNNMANWRRVASNAGSRSPIITAVDRRLIAPRHAAACYETSTTLKKMTCVQAEHDHERKCKCPDKAVRNSAVKTLIPCALKPAWAEI